VELLCGQHLLIIVPIMPGKPFQSKLEPFHDFIRTCREKRWSYPRIAAAITADHGMKVSANAVFSFVKVRSRNRRLFALPEAKPPAAPSSENSPPAHGFFQQSTLPKKHERRRYNLDV
jgi:hypothetical protein